MKRVVFLLTAIILLYLASSLTIKAVYGPSYMFPPSEDYWMPDGTGGWVQHGEPSAPQPEVPSVNVPLPVQYLPIFLPALLLALFMFGPLSKKIETADPENRDAGGNDNETDS